MAYSSSDSAHGAVGATSNPTIVLQVLRKERELWRERLAALPDEPPRVQPSKQRRPDDEY